jgi:hypothetical protein
VKDGAACITGGAHDWVGVGGGPSYRHRVCRRCGMLAVDLLDERDHLTDEDRRAFTGYYRAVGLLIRNPGPIESQRDPTGDP